MKTIQASATLLLTLSAFVLAQDAPFDPSDLTNPLANIPVEPASVTAPALPTDPDLPQPFDPNQLAMVVQASPFNRSVNMSDSLVLTGVAYVEKKPMATLLDKVTKRTYVVSENPNEVGWTLVEATPTTDLKRTQVKVNVAGEIVTIRHDNEAQMEAMKKGKSSPGGNSSGHEERRDDKGFSRDRRGGPPPEVMERYNKLSDKAKDKLRVQFTENRERLMNMNPEERKSYMENTFKKVAAEDESSRK